jgi:hypothetical protein
MAWERSLTAFGIILILVGIAFVLIPIIIKVFPELDLERIPWFLLYVYKKDGFFFATSPVLIIIGIVYFLWIFLRR